MTDSIFLKQWRVFMIAITDKSYGSEKCAQTLHTHIRCKAAFFFQSASVQWITVFLIIFSLNNTHTHTHANAVICHHHCCCPSRYWCSTHSFVCLYMCVLFRRSFVIKGDIIRIIREVWCFLYSLCFLFKGNSSITEMPRLIIEYCLESHPRHMFSICSSTTIGPNSCLE